MSHLIEKTNKKTTVMQSAEGCIPRYRTLSNCETKAVDYKTKAFF